MLNNTRVMMDKENIGAILQENTKYYYGKKI